MNRTSGVSIIISIGPWERIKITRFYLGVRLSLGFLKVNFYRADAWHLFNAFITEKIKWRSRKSKRRMRK